MKKSLILIIIAIIIIISVIAITLIIKEKDNDNVEIYTGKEVIFNAYINSMPTIDDISEIESDKGSNAYAVVTFISNFLDNNEILQVKYMINESEYANFNDIEEKLEMEDIDNIGRRITIRDIYINKDMKSTVRILIMNKESKQIKTIELSTIVEKLW